jgi:hypothetical protein
MAYNSDRPVGDEARADDLRARLRPVEEEAQ